MVCIDITYRRRIRIKWNEIRQWCKLVAFLWTRNALRRGLRIVSLHGDDKYFTIACSRHFPRRHRRRSPGYRATSPPRRLHALIDFLFFFFFHPAISPTTRPSILFARLSSFHGRANRSLIFVETERGYRTFSSGNDRFFLALFHQSLSRSPSPSRTILRFLWSSFSTSARWTLWTSGSLFPR